MKAAQLIALFGPADLPRADRPATVELRAARVQGRADVAARCGDSGRAHRLERTANRLIVLAARLEVGESDD